MLRPQDLRRRLIAFVVFVTMTACLQGTAFAAEPAALLPCEVADTLTQHRAISDWKRTLVDQTFRLPAGYTPPNLRSTAQAGLRGTYAVRRNVIADLTAMVSAARAAGARFAIQSAYRSHATQRTTFAYWVRVHGYATASQESARPGHSEHQLGTALDFRSHGGAAPWTYRDWGKTRAGAWLRANAWQFGFVMSYPKGKSAVTCYTYEPWHYRYVGRERAALIDASGLSLREFLWAEQNEAPPTTDQP